MAARKPLVMVNGQIRQIADGDTLDAVVQEVDVVSVVNSDAGALVGGNVVYVSGPGEVTAAQADDATEARVLGLVMDASVIAEAPATVQVSGVFTQSTTLWDAVAGTTGGLTPGAYYYLSAATPGELTETAPSTEGQYVVTVGLALSTTEMQIVDRQSVLL